MLFYILPMNLLYYKEERSFVANTCIAAYRTVTK